MKQPKITARKRSCGKVMFSRVSVCTRGNLWYHVLSGVGMGIFGTRSLTRVGMSGGGYRPGHGTSGRG